MTRLLTVCLVVLSIVWLTEAAGYGGSGKGVGHKRKARPYKGRGGHGGHGGYKKGHGGIGIG